MAFARRSAEFNAAFKRTRQGSRRVGLAWPGERSEAGLRWLEAIEFEARDVALRWVGTADHARQAIRSHITLAGPADLSQVCLKAMDAMHLNATPNIDPQMVLRHEHWLGLKRVQPQTRQLSLSVPQNRDWR